jgi:hypothetical protein
VVALENITARHGWFSDALILYEFGRLDDEHSRDYSWPFWRDT